MTSPFDALFGHDAGSDAARAVLDGIEDAIVACDADGVLCYFNRAARVLHGLPEAPLPAEGWSERYGLCRPDGITPLDAHEIPLVRALREGSVADLEIAVVPADGSRRHVIARGRRITARDGRVIGAVVSMHDVTERRALARERERVQLAHFAAVLSSVSEGVVAADPSGNVIEWNAAALAMHDFEDVADARRHLSDFPRTFELRTPEGVPIPLEHWPMARVLRGETFSQLEVQVRRLDRGWEKLVTFSGTSVRDAMGAIVLGIVTIHDESERRRAEEQLALQQQQLELVVRGANVGVWYCPLPFDRLIWDTTVKEHFDLAPDAEVTIETFYERLHPEDREPTRRAIENSIETRVPYEIEYRTVSADGARVRWIHASGRGFYDAAGKPRRFDGITIDVTEKKRAENELRQSERRFRDFADAAPAMLWITEPDGQCSYLSRGWYEYTGQSIEEGLGYGWADAAHPDDQAMAARTFRESTERRVPYEIDFRLRRADGVYRWVIDAGRPRFGPGGEFLGYVGSVIDAHERKEAERLLRGSEAHLRLAIDIAQLGTFEIDLETDAVTVDDTGRRIYGWTPDEVLTFSKVQTFFHPDDRAMVTAKVGDALRPDGPDGFEVEQRIIRTDGAVRWIRVRGRALFEETRDGRRAVRCVGTYVDITERQLLLASEKAARQRAEDESRLKDEFLATLSHELRTPLNAILGWSHLARGRNLDEEKLQRGLGVIERNARAQAQLVEDLLDMSRIVSGKIRLDVAPVAIADVIHATCETVRPAAEAKGVTLIEPLDVPAAIVLGDANRLQQIFWNILHNAVKFTPQRGTVEVQLTRTDALVEITVRDTGEGIRADFLPHVFDRFRQADGSSTRRHGGLGLGLSIVKQMVELHGGAVRAESDGEGRGATFHVTLPVGDALAMQPAGAAPPRRRTSEHALGEPRSTAPSLAGLRVLVIDDEADAREVVREIVEIRGAEVVLARSAAEGLDAAHHERPDVIVCDLGMPGADGYELLRNVRALGPAHGGGVPAIALTAFARLEDRTRTIDAGFEAHLAKPVEPPELVATIARLVGRPEP